MRDCYDGTGRKFLAENLLNAEGSCLVDGGSCLGITCALVVKSRSW